jgi:hypothetical protein
LQILIQCAIKQLAGVSLDLDFQNPGISPGEMADQLGANLNTLNSKIGKWDPKEISNVEFKNVKEFQEKSRDSLTWIKAQLKGDLTKTGVNFIGGVWVCKDHAK